MKKITIFICAIVTCLICSSCSGETKYKYNYVYNGNSGTYYKITTWHKSKAGLEVKTILDGEMIFSEGSYTLFSQLPSGASAKEGTFNLNTYFGGNKSYYYFTNDTIYNALRRNDSSFYHQYGEVYRLEGKDGKFAVGFMNNGTIVEYEVLASDYITTTKVADVITYENLCFISAE